MSTSPIRIPVYRPALGEQEKAYVLECLDTGWISWRGRFVQAFEAGLAAYLGVPHAAAVCNGTAALHLCMLALGLGPGDEVIVPAFTYIASANCIRYVGAEPVFVDSLPDTWQMDPEDVRRKITPRTKAILAVHLYGQACDMAALCALAKEHGLALVEDCAEALGTSFQGLRVGTFGDLAAFSFFGNKTLTTGEGGMVVCRDPELHARVVQLRGQGLSTTQEYWHDIVGWNFRMTNITAAIGLAQLERIDTILDAKRAVALRYHERLGSLPGVTLHREAPGTRHSYWMVSALVQNPATRDRVRAHLSSQGIETRPTFHPLPLMPPYRTCSQNLPVAMDLGARGMNLPSFPDLRPGEIDEIAREFARALASE